MAKKKRTQSIDISRECQYDFYYNLMMAGHAFLLGEYELSKNKIKVKSLDLSKLFKKREKEI